MSDGTPRELWLQYLSSVNDRALNKRRASGLTTWAIAGLVAVLSFRSLDQLPSLVATPASMFIHALTLAVVMNMLSFGILLIITLFMIGIHSVEARLESKLDRATKPAVFVPVVATVIGIVVLNVMSSRVAPGFKFVRWPFTALSIFFTLQVLTPLVMAIRTKWNNRKLKTELPRIATPAALATPTHRSATIVVFLLISVAGLAISSIPAIYAFSNITSTSHVTIIKWAFEVSAAWFLSVGLCFRVAGFLKGHHLEELERRIVLENLSSDDIRNLYIREYLGPTLQQWISEAEQKLERLSAEFDLRAEEAESRFVELAVVDRTMSYKITGRKKAICKTVGDVHKRYAQYSEELLQQMEALLQQKAFHAAPQLASQLMASWKVQLGVIKRRYDAVCKKCEEATQGVSCTSKETRAEQSHGADGLPPAAHA